MVFHVFSSSKPCLKPRYQQNVISKQRNEERKRSGGRICLLPFQSALAFVGAQNAKIEIRHPLRCFHADVFVEGEFHTPVNFGSSSDHSHIMKNKLLGVMEQGHRPSYALGSPNPRPLHHIWRGCLDLGPGDLRIRSRLLNDRDLIYRHISLVSSYTIEAYIRCHISFIITSG